MQTVLSWEKHHPDRAAWTTHALAAIAASLSDLNDAQDISTFAPNYDAASDEEKIAIWGELISAVAYFESGWNPCDRSPEPSLGMDDVTGEPVYSEGLLQLSYQDVKNYPRLNIPFDWQSDEAMARNDCSKTILDPLQNLTGGISILVDQIKQQNMIVLESPYWSTLGALGRWRDSKVTEIAAMVQELPFA